MVFKRQGLLQLGSYWLFFSIQTPFEADHWPSRHLGTYATQEWKKQTLRRRKNVAVLLNRVHSSFWASFLTCFKLNKSEHDFVFRPWGETLGCVQTPPTKNQG